MKAIVDERQRLHNPKHFLVRGKFKPNPEQPARIDALLKGAKAAGCHITAPIDHGLSPIAAIHTAEYLVFLETIHERWKQLGDAAEEVLPNVHPDRRTASYPKSAVGQAGFHQADTACPIAEGTWQAVYWSAQTALSGADLIIAGDRAAYALCRPCGHHAFRDSSGGFCFLNNTAIAANWFLKNGLRPAIIDVDVHHGNGTQGIFYQRSDVLTISLHADPSNYYPFFWGYAHERGEGPGLGYNVNIPMPQGTGDADYLDSLASVMPYLRAFAADVLVVALGLDAYENDPLQGFAITTNGFAEISAALAEIGLPTLVVQEGGYLCEQLGNNLTQVLKGFV